MLELSVDTFLDHICAFDAKSERNLLLVPSDSAVALLVRHHRRVGDGEVAVEPLAVERVQLVYCNRLAMAVSGSVTDVG